MVDPIEERQPVLHVVVYEKYSSRNDQKNAWSEANEPTEMNPLGSAVGQRISVNCNSGLQPTRPQPQSAGKPSRRLVEQNR